MYIKPDDFVPEKHQSIREYKPSKKVSGSPSPKKTSKKVKGRVEIQKEEEEMQEVENEQKEEV
jgi:hypothetical protein